ncbi:MAG TPA: arabinose ABC transporter permease, partial [Chloroflexia bacterium]|nr:arabinose ABC transporter permease [Chloroflexia bacterium]
GAGGVGAMAGTFLAGRIGRRFGVGPTLIGSLTFAACVAASVPLAGGSPWMAATILIGGQMIGDIGWQIFAITEISLRQAIVPERLLGRANASIQVLTQGMGPVGALVAGVLGEALGLRGTLFLAVGGLILAPVWMLCSPIRQLRDTPDAGGEVLSGKS